MTRIQGILIQRRRLLLAATALAPAAVILDACAGQQVVTGAQIAEAIATAVVTLGPALQAAGLSAEATAQVEKYAALIQGLAADLANNPQNASTDVGQIVADVDLILADAAQSPAIPPNVQIILAALAAAIPLLYAAYQLIPTTPTTNTLVARAKAAGTITFPGGVVQVVGVLQSAPMLLKQ